MHATLYVTMSVRRSVGPSVRPKSLRFASLFSAFRGKRRSDLSYCPSPTTILPLPTRTRLMLPCIRPCFLKIKYFCWHRIFFLIFHLRRREEVGVSINLTVSGSEIYTEGSLDISLHFGMKKCCRVVGLALKFPIKHSSSSSKSDETTF